MLPTPRLKAIVTYDDLNQALDDYASHYDMVRQSDWRNKIQTHRESMRKLWLKTHEIFLAFERELRSDHVSRPDYNCSWKFMDDHGLIGEGCDLEKVILEKVKAMVTTITESAMRQHQSNTNHRLVIKLLILKRIPRRFRMC